MEKKPNNTLELRCEGCELRLASRQEGSSEKSRTIVGYAAKFDRWSDPIGGWFREKIDPSAFRDTDMADVVMCFNHDVSAILARSGSGTLRLGVDETGLRFEFDAPDTGLGNDMLELVRRGDISKCSFAFVVDRDEWRYADSKNGLEMDERTILHVSELRDVSLVTFPAYPDTEAGVRSLEERKAEWLASQNTPKTDNGSSSRERTARVLSLKAK